MYRKMDNIEKTWTAIFFVALFAFIATSIALTVNGFQAYGWMYLFTKAALI